MAHPRAVRCACFSSSGELVLTGCDDGVVRLWAQAAGWRSISEFSPLNSFSERSPIIFLELLKGGRTHHGSRSPVPLAWTWLCDAIRQEWEELLGRSRMAMICVDRNGWVSIWDVPGGFKLTLFHTLDCVKDHKGASEIRFVSLVTCIEGVPWLLLHTANRSLHVVSVGGMIRLADVSAAVFLQHSHRLGIPVLAGVEETLGIAAALRCCDIVDLDTFRDRVVLQHTSTFDIFFARFAWAPGADDCRVTPLVWTVDRAGARVRLSGRALRAVACEQGVLVFDDRGGCAVMIDGGASEAGFCLRPHDVLVQPVPSIESPEARTAAVPRFGRYLSFAHRRPNVRSRLPHAHARLDTLGCLPGNECAIFSDLCLAQWRLPSLGSMVHCVHCARSDGIISSFVLGAKAVDVLDGGAVGDFDGIFRSPSLSTEVSQASGNTFCPSSPDEEQMFLDIVELERGARESIVEAELDELDVHVTSMEIELLSCFFSARDRP